MVRKAKPPEPTITADDLIAATRKLPRGGMSDFDGARAATDASRAAREKQSFEQTETQYTRLLTLLAEKRTPEAVATAMGWSVAGLEVFLTEHRQFSQRWDQLRKRLAGNEKVPSVPLVGLGEAEWDEPKRARILEIYVDTGDLFTAQILVGVTPSQFNREMERNGEFSEQVKRAKKQASNTLELRAIKDALDGNDKLLSQILKDKDETDVAHMSDAQLARRITSLISRIRNRVAIGSDKPAVQGGAVITSVEPGGSGAAAQSTEVPDPLS